MIVGTVELHLRLDGCFSLKDKRRVLRSLVEKARRDFQVAIAEVDDHDLWNSAVVGAACVSNDPTHADSVLEHLISQVDSNPEVALEGVNKAIERV